MRFLLDTNIFLDWLLENNTGHNEATKLVLSCLLDNDIEGYVTSHSLTDIFYILRKYHNLEQRKKFLLLIVYNFTILTEDTSKFVNVLNETNFFDLEDGLQIKCAEMANLDYIITENLKDFTTSKVPAIDLNSALKLI